MDDYVSQQNNSYNYSIYVTADKKTSHKYIAKIYFVVMNQISQDFPFILTKKLKTQLYIRFQKQLYPHEENVQISKCYFYLWHDF